MRGAGRCTCAIAVLIAGLALGPAAAGAATINVDNLGDTVANDEQCSVREAVTTANANLPVNDGGPDDPDCTVGEQAQPDTIMLGPGTHTLAQAGLDDTNQDGDLDVRVDSVSGPLTIEGQGSAVTEIDGADLDRVIHLTTGPGTLQLTDLRLDNGTVPAGERGGAFFSNQANATNAVFDGVQVSGSGSPVAGGGIYWAGSGSLTLTGSTVSGNSVTTALNGELGGGIAFSNGTLSLTDSSVSGNSATSSTASGAGVTGGGIAATNATLSLDGATIAGNTLTATGANPFPDGGGVFVENVTTTILNSTFSGNLISGGNIRSGGGLYYSEPTSPTPDDPLTIQNSTFSGNSVGSVALSSHGGGVRVNGGATTITATTFSGNTAESGGGDALYSAGPGAQTGRSLVLRGNIFNEAANACASPSFEAASTGYNLETDDTCLNPGATAVGDQQNATVSLAALASNGGPTQTHKLNAGSNGIDDVPAADCDEADGDQLAADQRGVPRPQGAACDIGAYELAPTCSGQDATIVGTGAGETIEGTAGSDVILAGGGGDTVNAGDGIDRVCAGDGNDIVRGGTGNDADILLGEGDTDTLSAADLTANTTLNLNTGTTAGSEAGSDTITGFENLEGGAGADTLTGNGDPNTIDGAAGNDTIEGLGGADTLVGGANAAVTLPGSPGDTVTFISAATPVTASLAAGTASGEGSDTLTGFESLTGGTAVDSLTGDDGPNAIAAFTGATSTMDGRGGNDRLQGNLNSVDTATYANQPGPVTLSTSASSGAQGTDSLVSIENLTGSPDDDQLTGDGFANVLSGGDGNDTLRDGSSANGAGAEDTFNGGSAGDTVSYSAKSAAEPVTVNLLNTTGQGETGENDTIAQDVENVIGGSGSDTFTSDEGNNLLAGQTGLNTVRFDGLNQAVSANLNEGTATGQGSDALVAIDNLVGSAQGDTLSGSIGPNTVSGGDGADTLEGRDGNDTLDGGNQTDTVSYSYAPLGTEIDLGTDSGFAGAGDTDSLPNVENAIGSAGSDIFFDGPVESNAYDGAGDADFVNYQAATAAMTVDLAAGAATGAGSDQLTAIENVEGGPQGDTITGDAEANDLRGFGGGDTITGGAQADDVFGGDGADQLLIRDGVADDADCGSADGVTDTVEADLVGTDVLQNCEGDDVSFSLPIPAAPVLTGVTPPGPANDNQPRVKGTSDAGTTLNIYATADCSGAPLATGTEAVFEGDGIPVTVADNTTTTFRATATSPGGISACSISSVTYTELTPPPAQPTPVNPVAKKRCKKGFKLKKVKTKSGKVKRKCVRKKRKRR
jgi:hypothetical protein